MECLSAIQIALLTARPIAQSATNLIAAGWCGNTRQRAYLTMVSLCSWWSECSPVNLNLRRALPLMSVLLIAESARDTNGFGVMDLMCPLLFLPHIWRGTVWIRVLLQPRVLMLVRFLSNKRVPTHMPDMAWFLDGLSDAHANDLSAKINNKCEKVGGV